MWSYESLEADFCNEMLETRNIKETREFMLTLGLVMPVAISLARGALKAKS